MMPAWPVRGMLIPFNAGLLRTGSGVSPCAICHKTSPLSRLIALMLPYGGFTIERPCTVRPPPPPPPPPPAAAAGRVAPSGRGAAGALGAATEAAGAVEGAAPIGVATRAPVSALPWMKFMSFFAGSGLTSPSGPGVRREYTYMMCVSGSYEPPAHTVPPPLIANEIVAIGPSALLTTGGVKIGPILYFETSFSASARSSG